MTDYIGPEQQPPLSPKEKRQLTDIAAICGVIVAGGIGLEVVDWFMDSVSFHHNGAIAAVLAFVFGGTLLEGTTSEKQ